jgi:DNA polymerase I
LQLTPRPRMGERVKYYIAARRGGGGSDWARARPLSLYDASAAPYDADYYTEKLNDWVERYGSFLGLPPPAAPSGVQGELF